MSESASIHIEGVEQKILFEWFDFDGDDCFRDFHILIEDARGAERFDFGDCAVSGLRRCVSFFRGQLDEAKGGFRFPDIRTYEVRRIEDGVSLQIVMGRANRSEWIEVRKPTVTFDDRFLDEY